MTFTVNKDVLMDFFQLNYLFISIIKLRVAYYEFPYFGLYMHTVTACG